MCREMAVAAGAVTVSVVGYGLVLEVSAGGRG
jgi:hypothetical protein